MKKEQPENESPDVIDLEWEEVQEIAQIKQNLSQLEHQLAAMCVNFEKTKQMFLKEIEISENNINSLARDLLGQKQVDESLTYELKLPQNLGEKGYFILK